MKKKKQKSKNSAKKLTIQSLVNNHFTENILSKTYVGIDFGTSTTVVSIASTKDNLTTIQSIPIELNQKLYDGAIYKSYKIPTMIGWYNNTLLIGEGASQLKLKLKKDKNLWHSFKMDLGVDMGSLYPYSELNNEKIKLLNPKDVTSLFLKYLKIQIEKYVENNNLASQIEYAVSIPASFEANQRKDLLDSLHVNNMMIEKQVLIDEPNAAFLSYVSSNSLKDDIYISEEYPTNILVFDFGAGTCDISILEVANSTRGYYSKNLAISRFEALGGNDIDKHIVKEILLPQFFEKNNVDHSHFKTKEMKIIEERLEKSAELLKIKISEEISLFASNSEFEKILAEDKIVRINHKVAFNTKNGLYSLDIPEITYHQFLEINERFTDLSPENSIFKSIFSPIYSAINKANLEKDDIDYVLFIGGSSKNYFIQKSLKDYFDDAEYLIPEDLQAHVSSGAAIHSLMYNGYNKNIIDPITSESILLIMKNEDDEHERVLLKAGTIIPCESIIINDLKPQREEQNILELPLCIGNRDKLLYNIKIETENNFTMDSDIQLEISINADKMLIVTAIVDGVSIETVPLNPFRNQEVSMKEKKKFDAEKKYNKIIAANMGKDTPESLRALYDAYNEFEYYLQAAEVLEELYDKYKLGSLNNIGVAYSKAGDEIKALFYYELDMEEYPSALTACNIALKYKYNNATIYKSWLERALELNPDYSLAQYMYGVILDKNGKEKGRKLIRKAFNSLRNEYENNSVDDSDIYWLKKCATYLNEDEYILKIEKTLQNNELVLEDYNSDNLTSKKIKDN